MIDQANNIETPGPGVTITIDNNLPITSGSLSQNQTWSGEILITGDVSKLYSGLTADVDIEIETRSKNVFSQQTVVPGVLKG